MIDSTPSSSRPRRERGLRVLPDAGGDAPIFGGRTPPHSFEAEEYLLACCLLDGSETIARCVASKLPAAAFYGPANRTIFEVIVALYKARPPVDLAMVAEELRTRGQLDAVGGYPQLVQVSGRIPTTAQAGYFIEKVRTLWLLRQVIEQGTGLVEQAYGWQGEPAMAEWLAQTAAKWSRMADYASMEAQAEAAAAGAAAAENLRAVIAGTAPKPDRIVTGLEEFDAKLQPFDPIAEDFLVILMGISSHGKSSLARNIVRANLRRDRISAVFLLETGRRRYLQMLAAEIANVNLQHAGELPADYKRQLEQAMEFVESCYGTSLHVEDSLYAVESIVARCQQMKERLGRLDLVVVDYVQILETTQRFNNRENQVAHMAAQLKKLGKRLNCTVLALAQINREAEKENNRLPRLADLRESGALGQAADRVIGIYRPKEDYRGQEQGENQSTYEQWICQIKFRNGPTGYIKTLFRKTVTRFETLHTKGGHA